MKHLSIFVTLLFFAALMFGCAKSNSIKTEQVTGTVTMSGAPVEGATVTFSPVDRSKGSPATGVTDAAGKYALQALLGDPGAGTTPGSYKVMITKIATVETGKSQKITDGMETKEVKEMKSENKLPNRYSIASSTPLTAEVKPGSNTIDFDLKP